MKRATSKPSAGEQKADLAAPSANRHSQKSKGREI